MTDFTHIADDRARMVDIGDKAITRRRAVAQGSLVLTPSTVAAIEAGAVEKGNVLGVARIAGIQAAKRTPESIPLCHHIPVTSVDVEFDLGDDRIEATAIVEATAQTGVEMEALCAVNGALLTAWDMVKSAEKDADGGYPTTHIEEVRVLEKHTDIVD